jgi:hypothetical protein
MFGPGEKEGDVAVLTVYNDHIDQRFLFTAAERGKDIDRSMDELFNSCFIAALADQHSASKARIGYDSIFFADSGYFLEQGNAERTARLEVKMIRGGRSTSCAVIENQHVRTQVPGELEETLNPPTQRLRMVLSSGDSQVAGENGMGIGQNDELVVTDSSLFGRYVLDAEKTWTS